MIFKDDRNFIDKCHICFSDKNVILNLKNKYSILKNVTNHKINNLTIKSKNLKKIIIKTEQTLKQKSFFNQNKIIEIKKKFISNISKKEELINDLLKQNEKINSDITELKIKSNL